MQIAAITVSLALAGVGTWLFVRAVCQIYRFVHLGQSLSPGTRTDHPEQRSMTLLKEFLGHTRLNRWGVVGVAHWFVAVGFFALVLTLVNAFGQLFRPDRLLPVIGGWPPYEAFTELIGVLTVLGIVTLIAIRQLSHPRVAGRKSRFTGSSFGQAYFVEAVILVIGLAVYVLRGLEGALHRVDGYEAAYLASYPLVTALRGLSVPTLQNLVYQVATLRPVGAVTRGNAGCYAASYRSTRCRAPSRPLRT
jgi:hypothetical protein